MDKGGGGRRRMDTVVEDKSKPPSEVDQRPVEIRGGSGGDEYRRRSGGSKGQGRYGHGCGVGIIY